MQHRHEPSESPCTVASERPPFEEQEQQQPRREQQHQHQHRDPPSPAAPQQEQQPSQEQEVPIHSRADLDALLSRGDGACVVLFTSDE